ncbi:hypothetical protein [Bacillus mojavensis]|uniref:hypothetical protein n=1 Tax=Bacillus mojavensis TaxID=72360 RepID=UPI002DB88477|nr:hypothetical protein [Bacillus mojavensis]MEC1291506.1 hypothetical protein [Bacillus mojavensis]MEC1614519.1 hypothetical protein [Bacillus mojavensis]MEC1622179.1 hypothetical protein [Bacillus mojavensis]MEC1660388.1 hypothetical protein [Bacillus mojavensis]MEC1685547.1 hypothetical protein [Bacillus mojavensis]
MKGNKFLLATMFSTTMLISGLGIGNNAKAAGEFPNMEDSQVQADIQEMKTAGMT